MTSANANTSTTYLPDKSAVLSAIQELVWGIDYAPERGAQPDGEGHYKPPRCGKTGLSDDEVLHRCRTDKTGEEFSAYYDRGDLSNVDDDGSRADWFITRKLAFYCGADTEQIARLFKDGEHYQHSSAPAKGTEREQKLGEGRPGYATLLDATIAKVLDDRAPEQVYRVSREKDKPSAETAKAWPEPMADAAYYGVLGSIARQIEAYIEADSAALLVNLIDTSGVAMGRGPYLQVGAARHHAVLYGVTVGETGDNKNDSTTPLRAILTEAAKPSPPQQDADGFASIVDFSFLAVPPQLRGLSSGEGLLWQIRDERRVPKRDAKTHSVVDDVVPGVSDKRLLVMEAEFARVLAVMGREGNILSTLIRELYDSPPTAESNPKNDPIRVTEPHVGLLGQITPAELRRKLNETDLANGFVNRFLWPLTHRVKSMPNPPDYSDLAKEHAVKWRDAVIRATSIGEVSFDKSAAERWAAEYDLLRDGGRDGLPPREGLAKDVCARAHVVVLRVALIFAALDGSRFITVAHLEAALAVWDYCERCAAYLFGDLAADPVENVIADALRKRGRMSRNDLMNLFGRHKPSAAIQAALDALLAAGKVRMWTEPTGGKPVEYWEWVAL